MHIVRYRRRIPVAGIGVLTGDRIITVGWQQWIGGHFVQAGTAG